MPSCPECGRYLSVHLDQCPECTADGRQSPAAEPDRGAKQLAQTAHFGDQQVQIARFGNGAEAGFFADELLHQLGIETETVFVENFSALDGKCFDCYLLTVPANQAAPAAEFLQSLVTGTDEPRDDLQYCDRASINSATSARAPAGGVGWFPILITLAAGSITYWGVHKFEQRPRPPALRNPGGLRLDELWDAVATESTPWTQPIENGKGMRRLWIERPQHRARLQEDWDGDGQFETDLIYNFHPRGPRRPRR